MTDVITITRRFRVPRELVFRAWTDPEQFGSWFGPTRYGTNPTSMEVRPGGVWECRVLMSADGGAAERFWGVFVRIDTDHRVVMTIQDKTERVTTIAVALDDTSDGGTVMRFEQSGDMDTEEQRLRAAGWRGFFVQLGQVLTKQARRAQA